MNGSNLSRRQFLRQAACGVCSAGLLSRLSYGQDNSGPIPMRTLGRTGQKVSILGLGGHHIGSIRDEEESIRLIRSAIDMGVTFMDNAWEYHQGRSEEVMGKALTGGYRDKAFLMTKHHGRDRQTAMRHLEDSLRRLKTDVIDLWQFHEVVYEADPGMIFAEDGGIEAARQAVEQGKVRYIGFTGHKDPAIFKEMLSHDYKWDAVQMPLNVVDAHFKSFEQEILPILLERNIGVIGMKSVAAGRLLNTGLVTIEEALRYAWSLPTSTVVSGIGSMEHLKQNVEIARAFKPLGEQEKTALLAKTREAAQDGEHELYKTTRRFDGREGRQLHGITG